MSPPVPDSSTAERNLFIIINLCCLVLLLIVTLTKTKTCFCDYLLSCILIFKDKMYHESLVHFKMNYRILTLLMFFYRALCDNSPRTKEEKIVLFWGQVCCILAQTSWVSLVLPGRVMLTAVPRGNEYYLTEGVTNHIPHSQWGKTERKCTQQLFN